MAGVYDRQIATALRLIKAKGFAIVVARPAGDFNPVTGERTNPTSTQQTLQGIEVEPQNIKKDVIGAMTNDQAAELENQKVRGLLLAASGSTFEPLANDICVFSGSNWRVLGCSPLAPNTTPILYRLLVTQTGEAPSDTPTPGGSWDGTWDGAADLDITF